MTNAISEAYAKGGRGEISKILHQAIADRMNETSLAKSNQVYWYVRNKGSGHESLEKFDASIGTKAWIRDNHDEAKRQVVKLSGVDGNTADMILDRLSGIA